MLSSWGIKIAENAAAITFASRVGNAPAHGLVDWTVSISGSEVDAFVNALDTPAGRLFATDVRGEGRTASGWEVSFTGLGILKEQGSWYLIAVQAPVVPRNGGHRLAGMTVVHAEQIRLLAAHKRAGTNEPDLLRRLCEAKLSVQDFTELSGRFGNDVGEAIDAMAALRRGGNGGAAGAAGPEAATRALARGL